MIVLGIDPGLTGALAVVHSERGLLDQRLDVAAGGLSTGLVAGTRFGNQRLRVA